MTDEEADARPQESFAARALRALTLGSLARLARYHARREEGFGRLRALAIGPWRLLKAYWRDQSYYLIAALWAALIFLPLPSAWNPFGTTEDAEGFLKTVWLVEAAALALSLAIIVFAVQAYRDANRERYGALRRYIRSTYLQEGYEQGVVALLITGVVLLGAGHGGVTGWAGTVAGFACLFSIAILPPLLSGALRTTHRDFLREEREERLGAAVSEQVDGDVEGRLALLVLTELAKSLS